MLELARCLREFAAGRPGTAANVSNPPTLGGTLCGMPIVRGSSFLLKWQRNEVLNHVRDAGLDPLDFGWGKTGSDTLNYIDVSKLRHKAGYYFTFDLADEKDWYGHFSPGELTQHETEQAGDWPGLIVRVDWWLGYLRRELSEPDLWQLLFSGQPLPEREWDNQAFSADERQRVIDWANEARRYLESAVGPEAARQAGATLAYIVDATDRLGHHDWREAARGALVGYVMTLVLPPDQAADVLRHLIGFVGRFLLGTP